MRTRMLLTASTVALVAASCSQPEPHVLSEAPRATTSTDLTSTTETTTRESQPGRFIARCATEADGGTPGMTIFTDGSEGVTDHCLSRYYIGVQPAPGALYVPDEDAGTNAPSRQEESESTATTQWTPSQPRTDVDPDTSDLDDGDDEIEDVTDTDTEGQDDDGQDDDGIGEDADENTSPTSPTSPEDPDQTTTPTDPDQTTTPGSPDPTDDEDPGPTGSAEPTPPTTVPTVTETPEESGATPSTSVTSTEPAAPGPSGSLGSGSGSLPGSGGSHELRFPFGSAHHQGAPPTEVQTPVS